eukprot:TRINITY_DN9587_c0_g1_i2.p1 TRINITY_DN9587_c0_g1~~TRINITY_DN9587_c0_g1_i2.p1  ORF type:complete len:654 (-),score=123.67 TRINITY_DN9587_c0_g1_i2:235-2151(-)
MEGGEELEWLSDYLVSVLKSPSWALPLANFVDERCFIFEESEENKFEYTACHNDYRQLVEDLFLVHLIDVSISEAQLHTFFDRGLAGQSLHHILVEQLLCADDFLAFKAMMVKRNADLDMKAALELMRGMHLPDGADDAALAAAVASSTPVVDFRNDAGESIAAFAQWPLTEDVLAWHDQGFTYGGVPEELLEATLFPGPMDLPSGTLTIASPYPAKLYIIHENSGLKRNGGLPERLRYLSEWVRVGGTNMFWSSPQRTWVSVWTRSLAAGTSVELSVPEPWVGGVAIKPDDGAWRLYEEQEEVRKEPTVAAEGAVPEEALQTAAELARDAQRKLEEAQLEEAIALSLQAEEERLRLLATGEEIPKSDGAAVEKTSAPAPPVEHVVDTGGAPGVADPTPTSDAVELQPTTEEIPPSMPPLAPSAALPSLGAPKTVIPRMVKLEPLAKAPVLAAPEPIDAAALHQLSVEAAARRNRAGDVLLGGSGAVSGSSAALAPSQPPTHPSAPTAEERRQRAEHLKRQRELILKKRTEERERELRQYKDAKGIGNGGGTTAVDRALSAFGDGGSSQGAGTGVALAAGLAGATPPADAATHDAAQKMRQTLTLQLRQTLTETPLGDGKTADKQLEQLDQLKQNSSS